MTRIKMALIIISVIFVVGLVIVFTNQNTKYEKLLSDYNNLGVEHQQLRQDFESFTEDSKITTTGKVSGSVQGDYSFIQRYGGMKYPVSSGLRRYVGEEPLRIYPNPNAPYVFESYKPEVVELINEVGMGHDIWCLVIDSRGVIGYVSRSQLKEIEKDDEYNSYDYGTGIETLGGFKVGDRIETLIGLLDRDYYLIYENGRIYEFPDKKSKNIIMDPIERPFSDIHSLDAFVGYTNRITRLRTNSSEFPLKDGHKVGDNAMKVMSFYETKYKYFG